jgi:hypothetical protein
MEIRNECINPSRHVERHVSRALKWINQADLAGIAYIKLLDKIPDPADDSPEWHQWAKAEGHSVFGMYMAQWANNPAHIILYVQDIYRCVHSFYQRTPLVTLLMGYNLAHEVGHHLQAERGYIFQPGEKVDQTEYREEMANRYAFSVVNRMRERWYYRLGQWIMKDSAGMFYHFGVQEWERKNYCKAAEYFYKSSILDPENDDAWYWHRRAKALKK